ncbi:transmembrane protein, putative [Medicago truncatula]|uniref:Transmembrane protein, putative n=1 Tax=Medicago truncatula TaxID=3880 RepID=G7K4V8_MEDTR|nr:transmembrane protein, putative [Medicago truncatula]
MAVVREMAVSIGMKNVDRVIDYLMGDMKKRSIFCWVSTTENFIHFISLVMNHILYVSLNQIL